LRILYFADIRFPLERANGIQTFQTCHALARRGHSVTLVVRPDATRPPRDPFAFYGRPADARLTVVAVAGASRPTLRRTAYLVQALARASGPHRADAVLTRDLTVAWVLLAFPSRLRPPVVYEAHGFAPTVAASMGDLLTDGTAASTVKQRRLARRERRVWRRADGYVAITQALADELVSRFGRRARLAVIPDGAQLDTGSRSGRAGAPEHAARPTPRLVAYAGHLYPWKGVDVLLEALAQVPDAQGLIVGGMAGERDLDRLQRRAQELGIARRVEFTGPVPPPQVAARLERAAVVVLPNTATHVSSRYTSPLKLFEYMASMRPIVASDLPSVGEVLRDGENALLVPPGDAGRLATALRRLLDDPDLAGRLAASARSDVGAYSWDRRAERIDRLLEQVTGGPRVEQAAVEGQGA
jgi:glycosyltransferase involved in cell wall biosynthesis